MSPGNQFQVLIQLNPLLKEIRKCVHTDCDILVLLLQMQYNQLTSKMLFFNGDCAYLFINTKEPETSFQAFFVEFFDKNLCFVVF